MTWQRNGGPSTTHYDSWHASRSSASNRWLEERTRVAREMHDVVAHGVSVMVIQAGAARLDLECPEHPARQALLAVESTGREVLGELRRMVSLLRTGEDSAVAVPAPGLHDIPTLIASMRTAGLEIAADLVLDGAPPPDRRRGLAAYRVVQEALTNALCYAGPTKVRVSVHTGKHLDIEVADCGRRNGALPARAPRRGGHGIVGMRERVSVYGGRLQARPERGGFVVQATIPVTEAGE